MNKLWKALRLLAKIISVLLVIAAILILWFFSKFFCGRQEYDVWQEDAIAAIQKADAAADPVKQLQLLHCAVETYLHCTDMDKTTATQEALKLLPRMQELQQKHQLPPQSPAYYLHTLSTDSREEVELLGTFIRSGLYDFSDKSQWSGEYASYLLNNLLEDINAKRHGETVDAMKSLVLFLLQQGVRTTWMDAPETYTDPVLSAVYTRDAAFLHAVLDCGLPARGINNDGTPEAEARWQNSPDLIEILRSHHEPHPR